MYAIGVGEHFFKNKNEIKSVVSKPSYSHSLVTDYDSLMETIPIMIRKLKKKGGYRSE